MNKKNMNSKEEWDRIWSIEGNTTWRTYPCTFNKICSLIPTGSNVLELGCGTGLLTYQIQTAGNNVIGLDISPVAINIMKITYDIDGIISEVPPIPEIKNIDVVVASQLLEHFEDPNILLKEMVRTADMCVVAVPNDELSNEICKYHHQKFTVESIKELLFKHYNHVEIYTLTDIFVASKELRIKIPVIICKSWGRRED